MRTAQVAPLAESVPPLLYGGTERVVFNLTEELVRQGHQVTLFASGNSQTSGELVPCCARALRLDSSVLDPFAHMTVMLERVRQRAAEFDVLHFHIDYMHFPLMRSFAHRTLTTLHGRIDLPDLPVVFGEFQEMPLISISFDQRRALPSVNWVGNVYHGLPVDLYPFTAEPAGDYLAFLGRICPEKRPDRAIELAKAAGIPLKMAAKVDPVDQDYFEREIEPLLGHPLIDFVGEIGEAQKGAFLGNARAVLFPIDWPEPFGLVMIEAMACGTPVIGFRCGSVPEVIEDGVSGFVVDDMAAAVAAIQGVGTLARARVRAQFERRLTVERMTNAYVDVYRTLSETDLFPQAA